MIYDYTITTGKGEELKLSDYKGKVILIVNTATGCGFTPQYAPIEKLYEDKLSTVFDDLGAARETQDRVREFVRNHPTVYCGTHTPQGYENLEAKRVIDLDNPVPTIFAEVSFTAKEASGKYVCSICGYVYDPAEHDGAAFEDLPDDWKCPRCKQGKDKFNKA